ncbi:TetR/AcrR family transcriptional regulator [Kutzneria kofuensis]|uniref:AcrR family transcriptional regulator n=1 Tax=Kutzneria kofuensis TaxID=103725 RepID=A0A7W9KS93_9PSEU|nr:TetR family transcriptional regulator [Kutzneria kofuensis]MBB5897809.1 AcrR family transcriptional regulator [Kutzneria kofuensis]
MSPGVRAEQARRTRAGIQDAALALFAGRGYDATSLQDIADELGLTKAAVYYHFPSKLELLQSICEPVYARVSAIIDDAAAQTSRQRRIDAVADGFADLTVSRRATISVLAADPVMHGRMKAASKMDDLLIRAARVIYGDSPTPDQILAVRAIAVLSDTISALPELADEEAREVLSRAVKRLLPRR